MLPTKFWIIWPSGFRGEDFQKSTNQKQELPVVAMFVNRSGQNEKSLQRTSHRCILPSFDSFGKAVSEEKIFQKSTDRDGMSNLYRGPSMDAFLPSFGSFGQAVSEEKIFRNRPIRKKNCLWRPCLLMDRYEMSTLYRRLPIDASYQVSVHLAKQFQRRRF